MQSMVLKKLNVCSEGTAWNISYGIKAQNTCAVRGTRERTHIDTQTYTRLPNTYIDKLYENSS